MRSKSDVEDRLMRLSREKADLSSQLEENEEELQEVMKKYKASVSQLSIDQVRKKTPFASAKIPLLSEKIPFQTGLS